MRRLLLVAPAPFLPARSGVSARLRDLVFALEEDGFTVDYVLVELFRFRVGEKIDVAEMRRTLGSRFHHFDVADYGPRWLRLLTVLFRGIASGWVGRKLQQIRAGLAGRGNVKIDDWYPEELDEFLAQLGSKWDVAVVAYVFLSRALLAVSAPMRVLDTMDVFSHRHALLSASAWFSAEPEEEARGLRRADRLLAISDIDSLRLRELCGRPVFHVGPMLSVCPSQTQDGQPIILLVGSDNPHNRASLAAFLEQVWPSVKELAVLRVAGRLSAWAPAPCQAGEKDDLSELYAQSWVCVNPDLGGTGISIKSLEALHYGRPLLSTPAGARGLHEECGVIVAELSGFSKQLKRILSDRPLRERLSEQAANWARQYQASNRSALKAALRG